MFSVDSSDMRKSASSGSLMLRPPSCDETKTLLPEGFLHSALRFPERPAVEVAGDTLSYAELYDRAIAIASVIGSFGDDGPRLTGVLTYRSPVAFAGLLGALLAGRGYVPLNPNFPVERTRRMLTRVGCRTFVIDRSGAKQREVMDGVLSPSLLIFPEHVDVSEFEHRWPQHVVVGAEDLSSSSPPPPLTRNSKAIAYVLFTSGSTGDPKGVSISHESVVPFIDVMARRYSITEEDRFSQNSDHTFDASVFDMFVAWSRGACVCCPSKAKLMTPDRFIEGSALTIWKSVPSVALLMNRVGTLREGVFPTLRWSLFGGEPLPVDVARAWLDAAPNSMLESTYGPTEVTVSCAAYRWDDADADADWDSGIVPIGFPLEGLTAMVVDEQLREVPAGVSGELLMSGRQVAAGYWGDSERTTSAFVVPPGCDDIFYRTGDRVRRPIDGQPLIFLGRLDHQVKIRGFRVELGEIEAVLRRAGQADCAVALAWPKTASGATAIEAFVSGTSADPAQLRLDVAEQLPDYMVPSRIHLMDRLPLTASGKVDREALRCILKVRRA